MKFRRFPARVAALFLVVLTAVPALASRQWVDPTTSWETLGPPRGTLFIAGGAAREESYGAFLDLVGRDTLIIVIPTAGTEDEEIEGEENSAFRRLTQYGATNLEVLHTTDRSVADSEAFVEPLTRAHAVFISGGRQRRLAAAYLHTRTHTELFNVLDRGGVIGGSSAGASIQGSYLVRGGREHRVGFGFIRDSAISQHYIRRSRMGSVARILRRNPELFGIGIDENTAVIARGNEFEVVGVSKVAVYDNRLPGWPEDGEQYWLLPGDRFDMASRTVIQRAQQKPGDLWAESGESWHDPAAAWATSGPPAGALLVAGRDADDAVRAQFLELVGDRDAPIVILSTGSESDRAGHEEVAEALRRLGAGNVSVLHTIDRDWANSHTFVRPLREARGVWIGDAVKWKLGDSFLNTLVHRELFGVIERNGVVAGEGEGGEMLASSLFRAGYKWTDGYGLLRGSVVHRHPLSEARDEELQKLLGEQKSLRAIGLAAATAIVVRGDRAEVVGGGAAAVRDDAASRKSPRLVRAGEALELKTANER